MLTFSAAFGFALSSEQTWPARRIVQAVGGLALLAVGFATVGGQLGFSLLDVDQLDAYISRRADVTAYGGSSFHLSGPPWLVPILAFGTVLFRPFPWEAPGITGIVTSLEGVALWVFVYRRRQSVRAFLRRQPHVPLFWMGALFLVLYATLLGMSVGNFGTLVRQRVHIYPFLFLFVMLLPEASRVPARARRARARRPSAALA